MHTADFDTSYDLKGKKVLNIGVGSSGVQVIPTIINDVDKIYVVAVRKCVSRVWVVS